jgi:hypothetical protein
VRTALLSTVLMVAVAGAAAEEPSVADANAQATAEAAPAKPAESELAKAAESAPTSERVVMIDVQDDEDQGRPFKPPPGYKPKRLNGEQVYCAKLVVLGSRFPKQDCRTERELRELELRKAEMRNDVDRTRSICTSDNGGCGMH